MIFAAVVRASWWLGAAIWEPYPDEIVEMLRVGLVLGFGLLYVWWLVTWSVYRVQDIGNSRWCTLLLGIPIINILFTLFLFLWPGTKLKLTDTPPDSRASDHRELELLEWRPKGDHPPEGRH